MNLPALDWHDALDYYALQQAAYQASETRRLQSSAKLQARKDSIVSNAVEKTLAAHSTAGPLSKRGRRAGKRANRASEKELERARNQWSFGDNGVRLKVVGDTNGTASQILESNEEYVPLSNKSSRIGELLEEEWTSK